MTTSPITPRSHQQEALTQLATTLTRGTRAQMIAACGTGKTLVGRWLAEDLQSTRTLVVLPSLMLVAQTLAEWRRVAGWPFDAFVCCSDASTTAGIAERAAADGWDLDEHYWVANRAGVSTSPTQISRRLTHATGPDRPLVLFSTYHSLPVVMSAAERSGHQFDLTIFDEAHHLAGHGRSTWRHALDDAHLPSTKRVFMTATPGETPDGCGAMANEDLFGPVAYRLTFAEAIERQLLVDYRVVVVDASETAAPTHDQIATLTAASNRGASRVISFHGRVAKAQKFAANIDNRTLPDGRQIQGQWISGTLTQGHRARRLEQLANPPANTLAVLTNARCLAEGVDVPAVDAVMFCDPKDSAIDITQAVGRALRPAPGKKQGMIILPVDLDGVLDDDTALATSAYAGVWRVLRHLMGLDERLAAEVRRVRRDVLQHRRTRIQLGAIDVVGRADLGDVVTRLVRASHADWNRFYQHLWDYADQNQTVLGLPAHHVLEDGTTLGRWAEAQRHAHRKGALSSEHAELLDEIPGWHWSGDDAAWHHEFTHVASLIHSAQRLDVEAEMVSTRIPTLRRRGQAPTLGRWCARQRITDRRGELDPRRRELLEQLPGWRWEELEPHDAKLVDLLAEWVAWKGDANVAESVVEDDLPLGAWLNGVRRRRVTGHLTQALADEIEEVTPKKGTPGALDWRCRETQWLIGFDALRAYVARTGECRPPEGHIEQLHDTTIALYVWVRRQRHLRRHGNLHPRCEQALETVPGWRWEVPLRAGDRPELDDVDHGTRTAYVKGCRCDPCTDANRAKEVERSARAAAGLPSTDLVEAGRARGHLRILQGQGASLKALARAANLNVKTLTEVADGRRSRVLPETEQTVLGLSINAARMAAAPGTRVPAGPTWELLDALIERGWPKAWIARELGFTSGLQLSRDEITAANAQKVADLHQTIGELRPPRKRYRQPTPTLAEILTHAVTDNGERTRGRAS